MYKLCMRGSVIVNTGSLTNSSRNVSTTADNATAAVDDGNIEATETGDAKDQEWSTVTLFVERKLKCIIAHLTW